MISLGQVVIAVIGALSASLIGFAVYRYRGLVTYELVSLSRSFKIVDNRFVLARGWDTDFICMERIAIANRGLTDIDSFKIHIGGVSKLLSADVISTKTLSKEVVTAGLAGTAFEISTDVLPRGEEIIVEIVYLSVSASTEYLRSAKGVNGKYRIKKKADYEDFQQFVRGAVPMLIISALFFFIAVN